MRLILTAALAALTLALPAAASADGYDTSTTLFTTNTMTWLGPLTYFGAGNDAGYPLDDDLRLSMYVAGGFWANRGKTPCQPTWGRTGISQNTNSHIISTGTLVGPGQCSLNQQKLTYDREFWDANNALRWSFNVDTRRKAKRYLCTATVHEYGHLSGETHSSSYSIMNRVIDPVNRLPSECALWFP